MPIAPTDPLPGDSDEGHDAADEQEERWCEGCGEHLEGDEECPWCEEDEEQGW